MTIGFYDIDLWHEKEHYPNLELMKIYKYCYEVGHQVVMMTPSMPEGRFNKIYYFKEREGELPKKVNVIGKNKTLYGEGFFGDKINLKPEILECSLDYSPYIPYGDKFKNNLLTEMINNSYIRFENKDFNDLKEDSKKIFFADRNILYCDGIEEFFQKYKNKDFYFSHPLLVKDKETYDKFNRYEKIFKRRIGIDFDYSFKFFKDNIKEDIYFIENEDNILKILKMVIWCKKNKINASIKVFYKGGNKLIKKILEWSKEKNLDKSFSSFYSKDRATLNLIENEEFEIRSLLKMPPSAATLDLNSTDF